MLEDILNGMKLNALKDLVGRESLIFLEQISINSEDSEGFFENESNHELVISAILNSDVSIVITDKQKRDHIIDRIKPQLMLKLINSLQDREVVENITPNHYENLKSFCDTDVGLMSFCGAVGISLDLSNIDTQKVSNEPFKRLLPQYSLYPYQVKISDKTYHLLETSNNRKAVIHLPTGAGKTRTAMHIICRHLKTQKSPLVLWLADSDILCNQAAEEFEEAWSHLGNREIILGRFYSGNSFSLDGLLSGVVVAGLQKLHSHFSSHDDSSISAFDSRVTLVIFDEAHRALARTYKELVDRFIEMSPEAKLIGLTATPGRVYKEDKPELVPANRALAEMFDNNKITMDVSPELPMEYLINNNYLAKPTFLPLKYDDIDLYKGLKGVGHNQTELLSKLSASKNRNAEIINVVYKEVTENNANIILFACDIAHARNLAFCLNCLGIRAASMDSRSTKTSDKNKIINDYKTNKIKVLVNCEMLTTGFDAPETNVAVIARPTDSLVLYLQMIGRALRGNPDQSPKSARIYTVIDDITDFNNVNIAFRHWNLMWSELD